MANQGLNPGPRGYETCKLPKSHGDLLLQGGIFNGSSHNSFKTAFLLKMFALLTSQSSELEKKQPKFPCGNLIISKDGQKWPSKTIFPTLFYLEQRFATST